MKVPALVVIAGEVVGAFVLKVVGCALVVIGGLVDASVLKAVGCALVVGAGRVVGAVVLKVVGCALVVTALVVIVGEVAAFVLLVVCCGLVVVGTTFKLSAKCKTDYRREKSKNIQPYNDSNTAVCKQIGPYTMYQKNCVN